MNDNNKVICPVCNTETNFGTKFCRSCGWVFEYFTTEPSQECQKEYAERLGIAKSTWNENKESTAKITSLTQEKNKANKKIEELEVQIKSLIKSYNDLRNEASKRINELELKVSTITTALTSTNNTSVFGSKVREGDYVQYGMGYGKPTLWKVSKKFENGFIRLSVIGAAHSSGIVLDASKIIFASGGIGSRENPYVIKITG